ncbi:hypothetical protein MHLP_01820 [Candidatus Mycoplasma haematolamae str. Purdue]|uniref:Uncharacterized protein n=1 Tax=Mycoplasma haematolamae (strain Purdue) TaxID=1212765 RepID=I7CJD3_MYCHA|nr:hypothetical protein MHLP_01820 [Candidatus Mycoplasma haematolamae str. Purdue]
MSPGNEPIVQTRKERMQRIRALQEALKREAIELEEYEEPRCRKCARRKKEIRALLFTSIALLLLMGLLLWISWLKAFPELFPRSWGLRSSWTS